jgi:sporulation protein YlmC with PRC-barrel domain
MVFVLVSISKIIGMKVITAKAYVLGEVKGLEADVDNWKITHLVVKLSEKAGTDLGFKKRFGNATVSMPVELVKAVGEFVSIDKSFEELSRTVDIVEYRE